MSNIAKIRTSGTLGDYDPQGIHKDTIYHTTDSGQVLYNGAVMGEVEEILRGFVQEWAKGKSQIIEALGKWGKEADVADSFPELAKKILELPVKGENEEGVIANDLNGSSWDLLQELNNHQRKDYPYCYGMTIDDGFDEIELYGADAYYTSDGYFYEEATTHKFDYTPNKIGRYVIFYFSYPEYVVSPLISPIDKIICLTGKPRFIFQNNVPINSIESYVTELYDLEGTEQFNIVNNSFRTIKLKGIRRIVNGVMSGTNGTFFYQFPDLEYFSGSYLISTNASAYCRSLSLPNLKTLAGTLISTAANINYVSLPKLEVLNEGGILRGISASSPLKELTLPSLETINAGILISQSHNIETLSLPSLKTMYGGYLVNDSSSLKNVYLPQLTSVYSDTLVAILINAPLVDKIDLPNLEVIKGYNILNKCPLIEEIVLPKLKCLYPHGTNAAVFNTLENLRHISLPNLIEACNCSATSFIASNTNVSELVIDMPMLSSTKNPKVTGYDYVYIGATMPLVENLIVNLGNPQDGYIHLNTHSSTYSIPFTLNIKKGFRSYLRISGFNNISKECLESIIDNLGDNTGHDTIQIVFGATNLAKVSDEKKLLATNKNYTLS